MQHCTLSCVWAHSYPLQRVMPYSGKMKDHIWQSMNMFIFVSFVIVGLSPELSELWYRESVSPQVWCPPHLHLHQQQGISLDCGFVSPVQSQLRLLWEACSVSSTHWHWRDRLKQQCQKVKLALKSTKKRDLTFNILETAHVLGLLWDSEFVLEIL